MTLYPASMFQTNTVKLHFSERKKEGGLTAVGWSQDSHFILPGTEQASGSENGGEDLNESGSIPQSILV